jgi:hypothetical protein
MERFHSLASFPLAILGLTFPNFASAGVTLPAAYGVASPIYVDATGTPSKTLSNVFGLDTSTTLSVSGVSDGSAKASAVVSAPTASISVEATATEGVVAPGGFGVSGGSAEDELEYFFEVLAPTTTTIGVQIQARSAYRSPERTPEAWASTTTKLTCR